MKRFAFALFLSASALLTNPTSLDADDTMSSEEIIGSLKASADPSDEVLSAEEILEQLRNSIDVVAREQGDNAKKPLDLPALNKLSSISMEIHFDYNSTAIKPESLPILMNLGKALQDPSLRDQKFLIAGHTDTVGSRTFNLALSQSRATAVRSFMVSAFANVGDRLIAVGLGEEQLSNTSEPEAAENRRVQVVNIGK